MILYDSLHCQLSVSANKTTASREETPCHLNIQLQNGDHNCGLFAITAAIAICLILVHGIQVCVVHGTDVYVANGWVFRKFTIRK